MRTGRGRTILGGLSALTLACALAGPAAGPATARTVPERSGPSGARGQSGPLVRVSQGELRGRVAGAVDTFLGIPYAAPPVGRLRWRAPQAADSWIGVRSATTLPPRCPQLAGSSGAGSTDENCLDLSVYRPHGTSGTGRLPVLFWIPGGGLVSGSGNQYDGSLLARADHMVVVSINYRLGVFGDLALPGLSGEASSRVSGDYGLEDEEAALRWTHRNIAAFGGDPGDITIGGQGAGGSSVCALLASPPVSGLFAGAILESGSCASTPQSAALRSGEAFARAAGCRRPATQVACLRGRSVAALLRDRPTPAVSLPTQGGKLLPVAPQTALATGRFDRTPVLIGADHDEGRTFAEADARDSEARYAALVRADFGTGVAARVLAAYPWTSYPAPDRTAEALGAAITDSGEEAGIGGCATENLAGEFARWTQTFAYSFDDEHAPGLNRDVPGYPWGAGDATELAYLWPSFEEGTPLYPRLTAAQRELSSQMVRYWGAFTTSGSPEVVGQPIWPAYVTGGFLSLRPGGLSAPLSTAAFAAEHQCAFWAALGDQAGL